MKIEEQKSLKEFTTFKIGGPARFFCSVRDEEDILEALAFADERKVPIFILGGGSNILVSDAGFDGLVVKMEIKGIEMGPSGRVVAKAGEGWDDFVGKMVQEGYHGLENLSLIPGTVGGAPVQNIGAYGSEVKDHIASVRAFDRLQGEFIDFENYECEFGYRSSIFKKTPGRHIIVSVSFVLKKQATVNVRYHDLKEYFFGKNAVKKIAHPTITDVREAVIAIRTAKLPDVNAVGTAGSFFKNCIVSRDEARDLAVRFPDLPAFQMDDERVKIPLAWILDHVCGFRGAVKGNVGTYKNQALVIINNGNATATEVKNFADEIAHAVREKTGIVIEPEVQYVG